VPRGRRRFSGQTRVGRYCRARYYHPGRQRFISEDPIGFAGGDANLYAYVRNSPLGLVDPLGLSYIDVNFTIGYWGGVTFGAMADGCATYPYLGLGAMTPGVGGSFTGSSSTPSPGLNVAGQVNVIYSYQRGYGFGKNGGWYSEHGAAWGWPSPAGASLTGFWVFQPWKSPFAESKPECKSKSKSER